MSAPVIVALDHDAVADARTCVAALEGAARRFKVGSVLFTRAGPPIVRELVEGGLGVFLDLKLHDTPTTVAGAVAAAAGLGVEMLTIHAAGGPAMIAAAARAARSVGDARPKVLAVTVLTSLDEATWRRIAGDGGRPIAAAASGLAGLAIEAGADGIVCSAAEVARLRAELGPGPLLVVPGIRPAWSASDHAGQARTAGPVEALAAGASWLVVGRAVTGDPHPRAAFERLVAEIGSGPG